MSHQEIDNHIFLQKLLDGIREFLGRDFLRSQIPFFIKLGQVAVALERAVSPYQFKRTQYGSNLILIRVTTE